MYFFFWHIIFSSLIPSFSFFMPSKRIQSSFTTTRQILDVFFILIFRSIVIYSYLFTFNWPIITLTHACLSLLMFSYALIHQYSAPILEKCVLFECKNTKNFPRRAFLLCIAHETIIKVPPFQENYPSSKNSWLCAWGM